jgi:hypothetical protein
VQIGKVYWKLYCRIGSFSKLMLCFANEILCCTHLDDVLQYALYSNIIRLNFSCAYNNLAEISVVVQSSLTTSRNEDDSYPAVLCFHPIPKFHPSMNRPAVDY